MSDKRLIAIVGATGAQGGSVANTFLADPSWTVRAITRSASSSKAKALRSRGAELFEANLNDASSLEKAFQGAHVIFGVTDFWTLYGDPAMQARLEAGQTMLELTYQLEIQQGKNILDAASRIPTLKRLVFSSLPNVTKLSGGKFDKAYHLDSKAMASEYGAKAHPGLWSKTSVIQPGFYLTNFSQNPWTMPMKNNETGTYDFNSMHPDSPLPMVATEEDTGILTAALVAAPAGLKLNSYREHMSTTEYAQLWSRVLGRDVRVLQRNFDQAPADIKEELEHTFGWANDFGILGEKVDETVKNPSDLDPAIKLATVEDWIRAQNWSAVIGSDA